eukprot:3249766-Pleurochrysis_carterae.AAC.4
MQSTPASHCVGQHEIGRPRLNQHLFERRRVGRRRVGRRHIHARSASRCTRHDCAMSRIGDQSEAASLARGGSWRYGHRERSCGQKGLGPTEPSTRLLQLAAGTGRCHRLRRASSRTGPAGDWQGGRCATRACRKARGPQAHAVPSGADSNGRTKPPCARWHARDQVSSPRLARIEANRARLIRLTSAG